MRDHEAVAAAVAATAPEIVIHMAAQSLVRRSFAEPRETYETNVMGTVNVLDAVRVNGAGVRALVNVTSDKCYENREWEWGYREEEPMGGHDPYSSSKGCAELVTGAFRRSFFSDRSEIGQHGARLASARAGNVIGGGDWGEDRLAARPHARGAGRRGGARAQPQLDPPVAARAQPAERLPGARPGAVGFARARLRLELRAAGGGRAPGRLDRRAGGELWPQELRWTLDDGPHPHEARYLKLDSSRARARLGWRPLLGLEEALEATVGWYRELADGADMRAVTLAQIDQLANPARPS